MRRADNLTTLMSGYPAAGLYSDCCTFRFVSHQQVFTVNTDMLCILLHTAKCVKGRFQSVCVSDCSRLNWQRIKTVKVKVTL